MNIYYLDRPLVDAEVMAAARTFRCRHLVEAQWSFRQHRVPGLFAQPAPGARLSLRRYTPLLRRHLDRIRATPLWREHVAMVVAVRNPLNGALAFALREASGLAPYIILRTSGTSVRVLEPASMLDVLDLFGDRAESFHRTG